MNNQPSKIFWFAPYQLNEPSTRYRGFYPIQKLKSEFGIKCHFIFPTKELKGRLIFLKVYFSALFASQSKSVIVIQKVCSNRIYAKLLKTLVKFKTSNTLYDIDDAEYLRQSTESLHFFLKNCSKVSVGSLALQEYCLQYNDNVTVVTSPVKEHHLKKEKRNKIINIGWVGDFGNGNAVSKDFSHKTSLYKILFPQLKQIDKEIMLTLIGVKNESDIPMIHHYFREKPNIKINIPVNLNWEDDSWLYNEIRKFDIGFAPLVNHEFNVCKSAFKAKQYLSVGIPTVASKIGENSRFVNASNGFLCQNNIDFKTSIDRIIEMSDKEYMNLSFNAIQNKASYSMSHYCKSMIELFSQKKT